MTISVHGHDDLGMAVANFMAAIEGGARQVGVAVGGREGREGDPVTLGEGGVRVRSFRAR